MGIIIIDDDPISSAVCKALLSPYRQVFTMKSCVQALGYLSNSPTPDLILLDSRMHGLSGLEMLKILSEQESSRHVPVLFMIGLNDADLAQACYAAGATDLIVKPILPIQLLKKAESLLRMDRLERENARLRVLLAAAGIAADPASDEEESEVSH